VGRRDEKHITDLPHDQGGGVRAARVPPSVPQQREKLLAGEATNEGVMTCLLTPRIESGIIDTAAPPLQDKQHCYEEHYVYLSLPAGESLNQVCRAHGAAICP
jgi:hypothetical protein